MNRDAFGPMFLDAVATPAVSRGYRWVGAGQTLAYDSGELTVALVRLGGKLARPGAVTHILCARHRFLRTLVEEAVPKGDTLVVDDYPYKLRPSALQSSEPHTWVYRPSNLGHWQEDRCDRLEYENQEEESVRAALRSLGGFLLGPVVKWAATLSPERASSDLRTFGENAWCERMWLEDYDAYLGRRPTR